MEENFYMQEKRAEQGVSMTMGGFATRTFLLMFLGLLTTFAVAFVNYASGAVIRLYYMPGIHTGLLIAELVVVLAMNHFLYKVSVGVATALFFVYSTLNGVVFSTYFLIFELPSLILVFAATALYFGGMAVFGALTHIDLSRIRTLLLGGLIFLIVGNLLMMLIPGLAAADRLLCSVGLVIFLAYTAYDTQKLKWIYQNFSGDEQMLKGAAVYGALQLYLDFINLFLYVLRLFGKKKN